MHASQRLSTIRSSIPTLSVLGLILVAGVGCATATPQQEGRALVDVPSTLSPPGTLYSTVDEAAIAALAHVSATTRRSDLGRLQVGSVVEVDGAFTWQAANRPARSRRDDWRPKARLSLAPDHVATFVIHPRTGDRSLDRANERLTQGERRIVDQLDPLHRPIYLLTPSGRIVAYSHGESASEIADLRPSRRGGKRHAEKQLPTDALPAPMGVALASGTDLP